jgi:RHS repeat-associated protein
VRKYYTLAGQVVALRTVTASANTLTYLQSDHLGSVSLTTSNTGVAGPAQEFDPWGTVGSGGIPATDRNFTGQRLDDTGLLFYQARYYDPQIGRFLSADTIVPGDPSGGMDGIAVKPLTVDFHEGGFLGKVNGENKLALWFELDDQGRQQAGSPWGPGNTQALNRYSYVQNNPLKYTDPTGHCGDRLVSCTDGGGGMEGRIPPGASAGGGPRSGGGGGSSGRGGSGNSQGAGRGGNRPNPDPRAEGPHSVPYRDPITGKTTKYTTYKPQTNPRNPNSWETEKRYRGEGNPHYNKVTGEEIQPPLVHDPSVPGGVRSARPDEIPGGPR